MGAPQNAGGSAAATAPPIRLNRRGEENDTAVSKEIAHLLRSHVNKEWGMTNDLVHYLANALCPNLYKGLYTPNQLLPFLLQGRKSTARPFTMIVNVGRHYVTVYCHKDYVLYLDPFGKPCVQPTVRHVLQNLSAPLFYNKTRIQCKSSNHCGLYAILFACYYDRARKRKLKFYDRASKKNDKLCVLYLHRLLNNKARP
jgi:hypothetical protein